MYVTEATHLKRTEVENESPLNQVDGSGPPGCLLRVCSYMWRTVLDPGSPSLMTNQLSGTVKQHQPCVWRGGTMAIMKAALCGEQMNSA